MITGSHDSRTLRPPALIYVETGVGAGHLQVAAHTARALEARGMDVTVATGAAEMARGFDFGKDVKLVALPGWSLRGGRAGKNATLRVPQGTFSGLSREEVEQALADLSEGRALPGSEEWHGPLEEVFKERQRVLREEAAGTSVLVTEFWPLGGRCLVNVELGALLARRGERKTAERPPVVAVERDIVFPGRDAEERVARTNKLITRVVVRGDGNVTRLTDSFRAVDGVTTPLEYVGYFGAPMPARMEMPEESRPVLVVCGGGARPEDVRLYEAAINAASKSPFARHPWRVHVPVGTAPATIDHLQNLAKGALPTEISIEPNLPSTEFRQLLANSALVITQAGYNTTLDIANGGLRAVFIPAYDDGRGEKNEQVRRAQIFSKRTGAPVLLQEEAENPASFLAAIERAHRSKPRPQNVPVNGPARLAEVVWRLSAGARLRSHPLEATKDSESPRTRPRTLV